MTAYYNIDKKKVVRVSTVLSHCEDKTHLKMWRERVGIEEAKKISNKASTRGTRIHKALELERTNPTKYDEYVSSFTEKVDEKEAKTLHKMLENYKEFRNIFNPTIIEEKLYYCDPKTNYDYAGTPDAMGSIIGTLYDKNGRVKVNPNTDLLIDYKNYARQKHTKFLSKAFLQLGAYYNAIKRNGIMDLQGCLLVTCTPRQLNLYYMDIKTSEFFASHFLRCLEYYTKKEKFPWEELLSELGYKDMLIVNDEYVPIRLYSKKEVDLIKAKKQKKTQELLDF